MITRMRGKAVGSLLAVICIALLVLLLVFNECSENRKEKGEKTPETEISVTQETTKDDSAVIELPFVPVGS